MEEPWHGSKSPPIGRRGLADQYEQRFLVRQPQEIDTIRHEISAMSDRQIETFADWLQEKGAFEAPALPTQDATSLRGFGLPRYPAVSPRGIRRRCRALVTRPRQPWHERSGWRGIAYLPLAVDAS
jgi:hypothetical protein